METRDYRESSLKVYADPSKCLICGRGDAGRPNIFKGYDHCSERCREKLAGEKPLTARDIENIPGWMSTRQNDNGEVFVVQ